MINIILKTLSKPIAILAAIGTLTLLTVTASNAEVTYDDGHKLSVCVMDGGVAVDNDGLVSCWNPVTDEITDCDNSQEGADDKCYTHPVTEEDRVTDDRFTKPALNTGTELTQPDTNTTVEPGATSLGGGLKVKSN